MTAVKLNKKVTYKTIVNERGDTVFSAIALLEEIIDNYQLSFINDLDNLPKKKLHSSLNNGWKVNYKYFEEKIGFKPHQTRRALLVLEKHKIVERKINRIPNRGTSEDGGTEVFILLNFKNVQTLLEI